VKDAQEQLKDLAFKSFTHGAFATASETLGHHAPPFEAGRTQ
jgi:hypothetical protein